MPTPIKLNHNNAKITLQKSFNSISKEYNLKSNCAGDIKEVIEHNHLTFKYILLTGLLGKATNPKVNPIILQSRTPEEGSYDARSLCHKVVVPFEHTKLKKRLGGSNEPFLNKPARYQKLDSSNATRRGRDRRTLNTVIRIFDYLNSHPEEVYDALTDILFLISELPERSITISSKEKDLYLHSKDIKNLLVNMTSNSCEGESLVIAICLLFEILIHQLNSPLTVVSHPVNQSGTSSKEVSDIDIVTENMKLRYSIEAKDKVFTEEDVNHAISKVIENGNFSLIFIKGPNARFLDKKTNEINLSDEWFEKGFNLSLIGFHEFLQLIPMLIIPIKKDFVFGVINNHIDLIRAKEETIKHLNSINF